VNSTALGHSFAVLDLVPSRDFDQQITRLGRQFGFQISLRRLGQR
jgi:hypothetical protein